MKNPLKEFSLLNDGVYPLSVILMETFWIFPWLLWIGIWPIFSEPRTALHLPTVILALLASLVITRICIKRDWPLWLIRTTVIGSGIIIIFAVLRIEYSAGYALGDAGWFSYMGQSLASVFGQPHPAIVALPALVYLWWRGVILGRATSYFRDIYTTFIVGVFFLVALIILWRVIAGQRTFPGPDADIGLFVIAFFFFGLISIAIGHISKMHRAMPREESRLTSLWRWMPMLLGVIGGMVAVSFLVATIFSNDFFQLISRFGQVLRDFFGQIVEWLQIAFNWLIEAIVNLVEWIMSLFSPGSTTVEYNSESGMPTVEPAGEGLSLSPEAITAIKWTLLAIIVGLIIFFLARGINRFFRREKEEIDETHESIWDAKDIRKDIRQFFRNIAQRFRRKPKAARGYVFNENPGRLEIRDIYRYLLWEGKQSGMPRRRQETVEEYAARLNTILPEATAPVNQITDMYSDVRYGDVPTPEEGVDNANSLWQKVRNLLRGQRRESS